jgi:hypothetical protein
MSLSRDDQNRWDVFLDKIKNDYPSIDFEKSKSNSFSSENQKIYYAQKNNYQSSASSLLHELGHLTSSHQKYYSDIELLMMESEAWQQAKKLSKKYGVKIYDDHIEDCLDSYRDWLHKRSTCPNCTQNGVQKDQKTYICLNCSQIWTVSSSRFCRTYRMTK